MEYQPFQIISHTADIQLAIQGKTWNELLENALRGTFWLTRPHIVPGSHCLERSVTVHGTDREILLVQFLSECLYYAAIYHETYTKFHVTTATETTVQGILYGQPINTLELEIKAVTYHELSISYHHNLWHARITYDI